jgi:transketolase
MNNVKMEEIKKLEEEAKIIRRHIVNMIYEAGSGHPGGSLSCVDILVTLYFYVMQHNPKDPEWKNRDMRH